jgi:hypothetical protein
MKSRDQFTMFAEWVKRLRSCETKLVFSLIKIGKIDELIFNDGIVASGGMVMVIRAHRQRLGPS